MASELREGDLPLGPARSAADLVRGRVRPGRLGPGGSSPGPDASVTTRLLAVLPFLVMAIVVGVDVLAGPAVGFLPLLSLGPALAAVSVRPARTMLIGLLAMLLCLGLAVFDHLTTSRRDLIALVTIAGVTAAGAAASAGRRRRERELADVTAAAEAAQQVLLRPVPARLGQAAVAVRCVSATASARIGGDLYDVVKVGDRVRLIIGDAQGKGLAAVKTAATVLGAFREAAHDVPDIAELAEWIESSALRDAAREEFVTAILAELSSDCSSIELVNCGHPPPLLVRGARACVLEPAHYGLPFGLAGLGPAGRSSDRICLARDDRLLFYTDGITEARNKAGQFYEIERCGALIDGMAGEAALKLISDDVTRHVGHAVLDDATLLLVSRGQAPGCAELLSVQPRSDLAGWVALGDCPGS